jgi:hypothetical protein
MRKNCKRTIDAWMSKRAYGKRGDSIWTDGDGIYSYATWILCERRDGCGPHLFNATKYSHTTTIHQNAIRAYMGSDNLRVYDNVPKGTPYQS